VPCPAAICAGSVANVLKTLTGSSTKFAPPATGPRPRRVAIAGDDPDHLFIFGPEGCIRASADFGATIVDKAGNIPVDWPSVGTVVGLCGG
jgi:hypothetical protein